MRCYSDGSPASTGSGAQVDVDDVLLELQQLRAALCVGALASLRFLDVAELCFCNTLCRYEAETRCAQVEQKVCKRGETFH
jgi:hypothetical protein